MEAVPYDYLEMPPKDMASVRRNLDIISSLMKELNDPRRCYPIHALIDSLKAQIFPKMDAFISQSEITLMEHFYPDGDRSSIDSFRQFEFQKVKKKFQAQQDSMDQQTRLSIRDMIMDLEYLYEMKALEVRLYFPIRDRR